VSLSWQEISELFSRAAGDAGIAEVEKWTHLTEGYRRVASHPEVEVPELTNPDATYTVTEATPSGEDWPDYFEVDCGVYAIKSLYNETDGFPMYPEPGGATGRERYLEAGGLPPRGGVRWWVREGTRIYLREAPEADTTIRIRFKVQVPELTSADADKHPLTPAQYDMAILHEALSSFFAVHKPKNAEGVPIVSTSRDHGAQAEAVIRRSIDPRAVEDRSRHQRIRLAGYRFAPRFRRGL
jgi:hypothetical protein